MLADRTSEAGDPDRACLASVPSVRCSFTTSSRARPAGAPSGPPQRALSIGRGSPAGERGERAGGPAPGARVERAIAAGRRRPDPLPSAAAHRRGLLPPRGRPRTRPLAVPAVTHPRWPRLQELTRRSSRAERSCRRESSQSRARPTWESLRCAPGRTLDSELPRQDRHLSGGRGNDGMTRKLRLWRPPQRLDSASASSMKLRLASVNSPNSFPSFDLSGSSRDPPLR